jgi:polysaccharide pyruvyl transferase WcaK-like protein
MTVFLAGAFGQGNPGDEALLSAFTRALGHLDPVASTCDPAGTEATTT